METCTCGKQAQHSLLVKRKLLFDFPRCAEITLAGLHPGRTKGLKCQNDVSMIRSSGGRGDRGPLPATNLPVVLELYAFSSPLEKGSSCCKIPG